MKLFGKNYLLLILIVLVCVVEINGKPRKRRHVKDSSESKQVSSEKSSHKKDSDSESSSHSHESSYESHENSHEHHSGNCSCEITNKTTAIPTQKPTTKLPSTTTTKPTQKTTQPSHDEPHPVGTTKKPSSVKPSEKPSTVPQFESSSVNPSTAESTLTPIQCPENSHQTDCLSKCAPTCESFISPYPTINGSQNDPGAPHFCIDDDDCHAGCQCNDGYLAENVNGKLKCVKSNECGCRDENNNYHNQNDTWYGRNCSEIITCINANQTNAKNTSCPNGQKCHKNDKNDYYCATKQSTILPPSTTSKYEASTPKQKSTAVPKTTKSVTETPSVKPHATSTTLLPHHSDQPSTHEPSQPFSASTTVQPIIVTPSSRLPINGSTTNQPTKSTQQLIHSSKSPSSLKPSTKTSKAPSKTTTEPTEKTTIVPTLKPNVTVRPSSAVPEQHPTEVTKKTTPTSPGNCPAHARHSNCTSSCAEKCYTVPQNPYHALGVTKKVPCDKCIDGCICDDGYVIDGSASEFLCIKKEECGCFDNDGLLHPANDTWLNENCTETYKCQNGSLIVEPHQCKTNENCVENDDFKTHCVPTKTTTQSPLTSIQTDISTDSEPSTTKKYHEPSNNITTKLPIKSTTKSSTSKITTQKPDLTSSKPNRNSTSSIHSRTTRFYTESTTIEPEVTATPSKSSENLTTKSSTINPDTKKPKTDKTTKLPTTKLPLKSSTPPASPNDQSSTGSSAASTTVNPTHTSKKPTTKLSIKSSTTEPVTTMKPDVTSQPSSENPTVKTSKFPSTAKPTLTPIQCPENSHQTDCLSKCASTCESFISPYPTINGSQNDPGAPHFCIEDDDCHAGCQCSDGYLAENVGGKLKCVKSNECGCRDENNNYHNQNDTWYGKNCSEIITCINANQTNAKNTSCPDGQKCHKNDKNDYYCANEQSTTLPPSTTSKYEASTPKQKSTVVPKTTKSVTETPSVKPHATSTTLLPHHSDQPSTHEPHSIGTTKEPTSLKPSKKPNHSTVPQFESSSVNPSTAEPTLTPIQCPENSHQTDCLSKCTPTCESFISPYPTVNGSQNDPGAPHFCIDDDDCHAGCQCNDGYLAENVDGKLKCVKSNECGCRDENNNYHNQNDTWYGKNCSEIITCINANQTNAKNTSCPDGQKCHKNDKNDYYCANEQSTTLPPSTTSKYEASTPKQKSTVVPKTTKSVTETPSVKPHATSTTLLPHHSDQPSTHEPHSIGTTKEPTSLKPSKKPNHSTVPQFESSSVNPSTAEPTLTPIQCPENSHQTDCLSKCTPTCESFISPYPTVNGSQNDPGAPHFCIDDDDCHAGCQCNDGYLAENVDGKLKCVKSNECGCRDENNNYHNQNDTWYGKNCSEIITCINANRTNAKNSTCQNNQTCQTDEKGNFYCESEKTTAVPTSAKPGPTATSRLSTKLPSTSPYSSTLINDKSTTEHVTLSTTRPKNSTMDSPIYECIRKCYIHHG